MKVLILYNPFSGKQHIEQYKTFIIKKLSKKYDVIDFFASYAPKSIIKKIIEDGNSYDLLLVSGGDGTFNEAANAIVKGNVLTKLAYIPGGTVNDVGSILRLPKNISKALDIILEGHSTKIDACMIDDKVFTYVCAAGNFTNISYDIDTKAKKKYGRMAYIFRAFREITKPVIMNIEVISNGVSKTFETYVFFALNFQQFGGIKIFRKRKQKLNDGIIDFTFVQRKKYWNLLRVLRFIFLGDRVRRYVDTISSEKMTIKISHPVDFNIDGEYAFTKDEVTFTSLKQALNVVVNKKIKEKNKR